MKSAVVCVCLLALVLGARGGQDPEERARVKTYAWKVGKLVEKAAKEDLSWVGFFDNETLECGIYRVPAGGKDRQSPHARDEVYHVVQGKGKFTAAGEETVVEPGSILFVAAGVEHRFHDVEEDLAVLVVFSKREPPAEEKEAKEEQQEEQHREGGGGGR